MNFPLHLKNRWGGKRYNSFQSNVKTAFQSRVYKVGLRMDFTSPNWQGKFFPDKSLVDREQAVIS